MAKIKKCKLTWQPSQSAQVAGYRLYWSIGGKLGYDSSYVELGMVNETYLSDILIDIPHTRKPILLGITSVDVHGNESDIVDLAEPFFLAAPPAPQGLSIQSLDDFEIIETTENEAADQLDRLFEEDTIWEPASKEEPPVE